MNRAEIAQLHWDITKLLEMGLDEEWVRQLTPAQATDLVKGLLYLKERYGHASEEGRA